MEEILNILAEIKNAVSEMAEKLDALSERVDELSEDINGIKDELREGEDAEDLGAKIGELSDEIEMLRGVGPDDSISDICNKLSVIIRGAGYEDDTLGLGKTLIVGDGPAAKAVVVTKYDADGIEIEYLD